MWDRLPACRPDRRAGSLSHVPLGQTMSGFIHDDFLLKTAPARRRYHEFAAGLPIIDYHNHLGPRVLADNRQFEEQHVFA